MQKAVRIEYTNSHGERLTRRIVPTALVWGCDARHPYPRTPPQWLLEAVDLEREHRTSFALASIHSWTLDP